MDSAISQQMTCPSCQNTTPFKEITAGAAILLRSRYDKLRPTLSAIEQTVTDKRDNLDPGELEQRLKGLYEAHPELFAFIARPVDQPADQTAELSTGEPVLANATIAQEIGNKSVSH